MIAIDVYEMQIFYWGITLNLYLITDARYLAVA